MHRTAAGKVEGAYPAVLADARQVLQPPIRAPSPAGDGVVHDGGPARHEDDGREDANAAADGAKYDGNGDSRELELVEHVHDETDVIGVDATT